MENQRTGPGFAVLYRWRLHEDKIQQFITAWTEVSAELLSDGGSLGSRLHRGPDGLWYSYAQWPNAETRRSAFSRPSKNTTARNAMREAIAEELPELILESVSDLMILPGG